MGSISYIEPGSNSHMEPLVPFAQVQSLTLKRVQSFTLNQVQIFTWNRWCHFPMGSICNMEPLLLFAHGSNSDMEPPCGVELQSSPWSSTIDIATHK